jgi:hypothetical protein
VVANGRGNSVNTFRGNIAAILCCAALLLLFSATCEQAWSKKGDTFDEPLHLVSSLIQVHDFDFRCDPEDPPLWKYFVAAGAGDSVAFDQGGPAWNGMLTSAGSWVQFAQAEMVAQPAQMIAAINAGRMRMILLGVALGALIAWWAWRLAGKVAAIIALAAFCLDPNFLAHSLLIKNDVAISLAFLALMAAVWMLGERATILRWGMVTLMLGVALTTKFSGLLAIPMLGLALVLRALLPQAWQVLKWTARTRSQRLIAGAAMAMGSLIAGYVLIWAAYGFRFGPTQNPNEMFNDSVVEICQYRETIIAHGSPRNVQMSELKEWSRDWHPSRMVKTVEWMNEHRVLPQAWLTGLLYTYATSLTRPAFLLGETSISGWWYYFLLAMLFKTPLATLGAIALAGVSYRWWRSKRVDLWPICAAVCPVLYMAVAMRSHLNLGIRHMLPVYPFLFIFLGVAAARSWQRWPQAAGTIIAIFLVGLTVETYAAFPDFIPFFNVAAGGSRGGLDLLGDSNIDWGQDLPALAKWQSAHAERPMYLCYFGSSDPRAYGIHYVNLPGSDAPADQPAQPTRVPPVIAISASMLQGVGLEHTPAEYYDVFRSARPIGVLGGSIYLFDPPAQWRQAPGGGP